jgi:hypothetical protein
MKRLLLLAVFLFVGVSLGMVMLLVPAEAPHVAAYDGQASATMSCTDNTATMTRTVLVTITWKNVNEGGAVAEADVQVYENSPANLLAWGSTKFSPLEARGTVSFTLSFNDTTPFGNVQWQLYNPGHIAPVKAGLLDASNFPGCPYP